MFVIEAATGRSADGKNVEEGEFMVKDDVKVMDNGDKWDA